MNSWQEITKDQEFCTLVAEALSKAAIGIDPKRFLLQFYPLVEKIYSAPPFPDIDSVLASILGVAQMGLIPSPISEVSHVSLLRQKRSDGRIRCVVSITESGYMELISRNCKNATYGTVYEDDVFKVKTGKGGFLLHEHGSDEPITARRTPVLVYSAGYCNDELIAAILPAQDGAKSALAALYRIVSGRGANTQISSAREAAKPTAKKVLLDDVEEQIVIF